ncbi:anti-repressor SinI family protein [Paenibacillus tepidiphilus]|uniref:anti-repressor SinI family protein n=1 Tax=Paenibacillus tepidiphilus TaxID=2608683 RepID=UPI001EF049DE|nr:anti-repressor SinI family protein [Paenibacillus tepidiphilus]
MKQSNQGNNGELRVADLDREWVYLLMAAKKMGIKAEDIREFLNGKTLQAM